MLGLGLDLSRLFDVEVGDQTIHGIDCEWAPERSQHLQDRTAFDAVEAGRSGTGEPVLVALEVKYVNSFSRGTSAKRDGDYRAACERAGMVAGAFDRLGRGQTGNCCATSCSSRAAAGAAPATPRRSTAS